jgi:hypothetical protein
MEEVRATVVSSEAEAEMLCGLLREQGIDCCFRKTDVGVGASGGMLSGFGWTEVIVHAGDLERAREVLGLDVES